MNSNTCNNKDCNNVAEHKCGRCKQVYYCSQKCQRSDWKEHKLICAAEKVQYAVGIPTNEYNNLKVSLKKGKKEYLQDRDGKLEEVFLKDDDIYEKTTSRKIIPIDNQNNGMVSSDRTDISNYPKFLGYYGSPKHIVEGCNLFVSDDKKKFSVYMTKHDMQLVCIDFNSVKKFYKPNEYLPESIFKLVEQYINQGYTDEFLMEKQYIFTGTSGIVLSV